MAKALQITPKTKRNFQRILPFGIIWVLNGWVTIITEISVTGNQNLNPDTDIAFTVPVLIFANIANLFVGLTVGALEVVYLAKRFVNYSLRAKFFYKFLIYSLLFLLIILAFYPLAFTLETGISLLEADAWQKLGRFLKSIAFYTTLFHLSVALLLSLIYSAISENLGHHVFLNFISGKYHKPKVEKRIFMFLDMKSSTTIAEELGHVQYFKLLQEYYNLMSDPIINTSGEVYQYIGDEVVISWSLAKGLKNSNCVQAYFAMLEQLQAKQTYFKSEYGVEVGFKAGMHLGEVTIGEIGALKKEIVYSGDVLNTSSRIQSLCKEYQSDLLISEDLKDALADFEGQFDLVGEVSLRGRKQEMKIYKIAHI